MNLRQLEVFGAVMKARSVSEAARRLHVSQPAVSKALRLLEEQLGVTLFQRVRGRLYPSPEAEALHPEFERVFGALDAASAFAEELRDGVAGQVSIAAVPTLATAFLPEAVSAFRRDRPRVRIDIRALPTTQILEMLAAHQLDLALVHAPAEGVTTVQEDLCEYELVCLLPRGHDLAGRAVIDARDLAREGDRTPLISFHPDTPTGSLLLDALRRAGLPYAVAIEVNQTSTACSLVQAGAGIALVDPFIALAGGYPDLVIRPFRPRLVLRPRLLHARHRPMSRLAAAAAAELRRSIARLAGRTAFPIRPL